jgi:hypothetical protein
MVEGDLTQAVTGSNFQYVDNAYSLSVQSYTGQRHGGVVASQNDTHTCKTALPFVPCDQSWVAQKQVPLVSGNRSDRECGALNSSPFTALMLSRRPGQVRPDTRHCRYLSVHAV